MHFCQACYDIIRSFDFSTQGRVTTIDSKHLRNLNKILRILKIPKELHFS